MWIDLGPSDSGPLMKRPISMDNKEQLEEKVQIARALLGHASIYESLRGWWPMNGMAAAWRVLIPEDAGEIGNLIYYQLSYSSAKPPIKPWGHLLSNTEARNVWTVWFRLSKV